MLLTELIILQPLTYAPCTITTFYVEYSYILLSTKLMDQFQGHFRPYPFSAFNTELELLSVTNRIPGVYVLDADAAACRRQLIFLLIERLSERR